MFIAASRIGGINQELDKLSLDEVVQLNSQMKDSQK